MRLVEKQLVSIDWDLRNLRVVAFSMRAKGGIRIRKVLSVAIPADVSVGDPAALGRLLVDVLARERIDAKRMIVDVPRDQAVLNTLRLPAVPLDDLPSVVEFQIGKELPFPLAAAVTDFAVPDAPDDKGIQEVLVAAVRLEALEYYKQTAEAAGLKLERVGLRPYANKVAVNELLGETRRERVLFVDVGPVLTEIDVLRDGKLAFSRAASVLVPRLDDTERPAAPAAAHPGPATGLNLVLGAPEAVAPEHEAIVQSLVREVALTLEAYRAGDPGADMDHVVVGGDTGLEDALLAIIRKRFGLSGERYNPTACFGWDGASGAAAGGFAAALGLALGHATPGRLDFNFIHPKKSVPVTQRRLRKAPIAAAILVLFTAAALVAYARVVGPQKKQLASLEKQLDDANARLKEYKRFGEMMKKVEEFEQEQIIWIDELADFLSVWPSTEQIVVSQLDLSQKDALIQMKLDCKDRSDLDQTVSVLDAFRRDDSGPLRFDATQGTSTSVPNAAYGVRASMDIRLENRGSRTK
jgi:type IV pilus assembly protein PilM